jgi:hypothetical protein
LSIRRYQHLTFDLVFDLYIVRVDMYYGAFGGVA